MAAKSPRKPVERALSPRTGKRTSEEWQRLLRALKRLGYERAQEVVRLAIAEQAVEEMQ